MSSVVLERAPREVAVGFLVTETGSNEFDVMAERFAVDAMVSVDGIGS